MLIGYYDMHFENTTVLG